MWPQQGHSWVWIENREVCIPSLKLPLMFYTVRSRRRVHSVIHCVALTGNTLWILLSAYVQVRVPEVCVSASITDSMEEGLTSGRLAVSPPQWWAPVVALGNCCQGEGPTGAAAAGNVSSLRPKWMRSKWWACAEAGKNFDHKCELKLHLK